MRPQAIKENNEDQFEKLIHNLGSELKELKNTFPLTIVYTSLHLCGFGYNLIEQQLGTRSSHCNPVTTGVVMTL